MKSVPSAHYRFVGCCPFCSWVGGQCKSPVPAGRQAAHHSETVHPEKEGIVGYIRKIRVRKLMPPDIAMRQGKAPQKVYSRRPTKRKVAGTL